MFWILTVAASLALLALALFVIGHNMAPEYGGRVERSIAAPPEAVFAALRDVEAGPHGGSMCRAVRIEDPDAELLAWTEDLGSSKVHARTLESEAPRVLVREMRDSIVALTARWEFSLEPEGAGTRLVLVHRGRVDDGTWHSPLFRLLIKGLGLADRGARQYLDSVAERAAG